MYVRMREDVIVEIIIKEEFYNEPCETCGGTGVVDELIDQINEYGGPTFEAPCPYCAVPSPSVYRVKIPHVISRVRINGTSFDFDNHIKAKMLVNAVSRSVSEAELKIYDEVIAVAEEWLADKNRTCTIASVLRRLKEASRR